MNELKLRLSLACALLICMPAAASAQVTGERAEAPPEADTYNMLRQGDGVEEQQVRDMEIVGSLKAAYLREEKLNPANIDIRAEDGEVHLSGTAPSEEAREVAVKIAKSTENVTDVVSEIEIADGN